MALDYGSVKDMYDTLYDSGVTTKTLPEWSQDMNELTGSNLYTAGLHDNIIKRASHGIDKLLEATGLPGYGEQLGRTVGGWVGAPEAGAEVGHGLARSTLNFAPLLIPGGGVPGAILKFGLTGALTGAETYEKTDSPLSALISAGVSTAIPGIAGKTSELAGQAIAKSIGVPSVTGPIADLEGNLVKNVTQYFPKTPLEKLLVKGGGEAAGQVAAAGTVGVSQPLEQLAQGEEPTSPFTTENLLGLTLGQAPFAAIHLGTRALGYGPTTPTASELEKTIALSKARIELKSAKQEQDGMTDVEKIPEVPQPDAETLTPQQTQTAEQTRSLLSKIRGEQVEVAKDPNLTDEQKLEQQNLLSQREYALTQQNEVNAGYDTILGNGQSPDDVRQEVVGNQLYSNRNGTWRAIHVADDPANPEELRGKVIGYSTLNEPAPVRVSPEGTLGKYSLPDAQWQNVKTLDEWNSKFRRNDAGQPELPDQEKPMTVEELNSYMHDLDEVETKADLANTSGDLQQSVVGLQAVQEQNNLTPTSDATLKKTTQKLVEKGVQPDEAVKSAVKVEAKRTARKITASQRELERATPELTPEEAADITAKMGGQGFSVMTADKLMHREGEIEVPVQEVHDMVTDAAMSTAKSQTARDTFNTWDGREDTTYEKDFKDFIDLVENYGSLKNVPLEEAGKLLAERTGTVPWDKGEVQEFIDRPHVQEWARALDSELGNQQSINAAPIPNPPVVNIAGRKGSLLTNDTVYDMVENFTKGQRVTDAFGGSGQLAMEATHYGTKMTMNVKNPEMFAMFQEMKQDPDGFAKRVNAAVGNIVSNRGQSVPTTKTGEPISEYLDKITASDPNVGLFLKQNLNARGREIAAGGKFSPTKVISSAGLQETPTRIQRFARLIENVSNEDGWDIVSKAGEGDRVMVDPPYVGTRKGMYADVEGVSVEKQLDNYYQHLFPAAERGAQFVVFDVAEPQLIKALEDHGFKVEQVQRTSRGGGETKPELVATNSPETIQAAPKTVGREDAPIWTPEEQRDIDTIERMGLAQGGKGMLNFLLNGKYFSGLAKDLSKFSDSLDRTIGSVREIGSGAFAKRIANKKIEVVLSPAQLRASQWEQEYTVAHELVHALSVHELDNPTNTGIYNAIDSLRDKVISKLPQKLQDGLKTMQETGWMGKWHQQEVPWESMLPGGTQNDRLLLYSLHDTHEFVAQGLSDPNFRTFLQGIKTNEGQTWFHRFAGYVKDLLKIGENVDNNAFAEFLDKTDQLLDRGNYVASFRNFANRYFENLGQSRQFVSSNTQRAMALVLDSVSSPFDALASLRQGAGGVRSPEWATANRDVTRMFNKHGDDAAVTQKVLDETGHKADQSGLADLADSLMLGETNHDVLDLLPEAAVKHVFATARDAQNIFGSIHDATLAKNKGFFNIASPEMLQGVAKDTLQGIDKVLEQERLHDMQVKEIQQMFNIPPDAFASNMFARPESVPEWATDETKKSWGDAITRFLEPIGQMAKRIPEAAEAFSRGWQLNANARKMLSESMKAFGMDLTTMKLTKETVKQFAQALKEPRLVNAANKWIYENQVEGKTSGETRVIDVDDPRIEKIVGALSPKDRDIVEDIVNKHSISMQHMQEQILEKGLQIASTNGAVIAQQATGGKLKDAVLLSDTLMKAFTVDRTDPNAASVADAQIQSVQSRMTPDGFLELAKFAQNAAEVWKTQREWFKSNPAWSTAQRYGKFLAEFRKGGKTYVAGVDSRKEAEALAQGRPFKFSKNTKYDEDRPPILGPDAPGIINRMRELEQNQHDMLRNRGFTPEDIEQMKRTSPSEQFATEETYRGGVPELTPPPRGLTKGAEELPWLRNHFSWVSKTSNYWSRQLLRAQARAHLLDPEIAQNEQLRKDLQTHYDNILQPDSQVGRLAQRSVMAWFMGFNPASALINGTQPFLTHVAELTAMSGKPLDSYRRVLGALKDVYASGLGKREWKDPEIAHLMQEAASAGERDLALFDDQAAEQESIHTNYKRILSGNQVQTLGQRLSTLAGSFSSGSMLLFKTVERINNDAALIASYKYYRESEPNLSPDQAIQKAFEFNHAVNFGGGRAQRPIGAFAGRGAFPRTVAMLATSMQSYNLGTAFQIARYIRSGFFRPEGLTPAEIHNARTAVVQMLGTQLAAAGALGLPFVSGMLSVLNQAFPNLELNRKLKESMNAVLGGDGENGHVLADIAMTGAPSMLGWDLQSRLSMGNTLPGVSEINGFQPENLLGAPANLVSNFVQGGYKLATGDTHGIDNFVPSGLKKFEQLLRSGGQVLDYRNRPIFTPTLGEKVGIALGFQPKRLTDFNNASRIARQADDNIKRREGQFHQELAGEILKGNFGTVRQALLQRSREDKTYDPVQAVRSISGAAEELTFPRDLRREGTVQGGDMRGRLLSTFNLPQVQPTETDRLKFRQSVQQRLGLMTTSATDLQTAQVVDSLRTQNPTASRSELRQQATLLLRGRRLGTLASPVE